MNKKSQVTIFILLGFVILLLFGFTYFFLTQSTENKSLLQQSEPDTRTVGTYVLGCIETTLEDGLDLLGVNETQLEIYVNINLKNCTDGFKVFKGVDITEGDVDSSIKATSTNNALVVEVIYPITMERKKIALDVSKFNLLYDLTSGTGSGTLNNGVAEPDPESEDPNTIKIMPLGDSITDVGQYRPILWNKLKDAGYNVDFVGSQDSPSWEKESYGDYDYNHEGHSGWRAEHILNGNADLPGSGNIDLWMNTYNPDIVLLFIGGNDYLSARIDSPPITSPQDYMAYWSPIIVETNSEILSIYNRIKELNPDATVLFGQIYYLNPLYFPTLPGIFTENSNAHMTQTLMGGGVSAVNIIDHSVGWDYNTDINPDEQPVPVHPNGNGGQKIADNWYNILVTILPEPEVN